MCEVRGGGRRGGGLKHAAIRSSPIYDGSTVQHQEQGGKALPVDVYGSGEDMEAIKQKAKDNLSITFHDGVDHLDDVIHSYRCYPAGAAPPPLLPPLLCCQWLMVRRAQNSQNNWARGVG